MASAVIVGIGLDVVDITRVARVIERWGDRFTGRVFTPAERAFARARADSARHFAARFAAKEATIKALGGPVGLRFKEMEVAGGGSEPPRLELSGQALALAQERGIIQLHLSLSHSQGIAAAVVVAEAEPAIGG